MSRVDLPPQEKTSPLSFSQERLWFLDHLQRGSVSYNRPVNVHMLGPLHVAALQQSLDGLIGRHESLRMRFLDRGPSVEVLPFVPKTIELVDLSSRPDAAAEADRFARQEASLPFDLQARAPIRLKLLRLGAEDHLLLCTLHHIIFDGWSQNVFLGELTQLYETNCRGCENSLPKLPVEYSEIAIAQRRRLADGQLESHIDYWRQQLSGSASNLRLPTDYVPSTKTSDHGSRHVFKLPAPLTEQLAEFNRNHRVTMFMTLFAAFQVLLYRYTGQTNITTGTPIAGRTNKDMEGLIGLVINTLPLRIDLGENPTFSALLSRVRKIALEAYQHQEVPLQTIIEQSVADRSAADSPLFNTLFNLQPAIEPVQVEGLTFRFVPVNTDTAKADLSMDLKFSPNAVFGELEYRSGLFTAATVKDMATHWVRILQHVAKDPATHLDDIPLIDNSERDKLTVKWNQTGNDYPTDVGVHELIEARVARSPEKTSVVKGDVQLSYAELDQRANQLANYLATTIVPKPSRIVLLAERSVEMIVAMVGILKAGACYIPVDPTTPAERIRFILAETQSTLLTTHETLAAQLCDIEARHVCLERDERGIAQQPNTSPRIKVGCSELAYIIYTSGSTGEPKGVMIEHDCVVNYARTVGDVLGVTETDRVLQFASIGFDASVEEIFGALTSGATLVLRDQDSISSIPKFIERIAQWEITFASLPTAFWHELAHQMRADSLTLPPCLKTVVLGGQKASHSALEAWQHSAPDHITLFNTYGPTEATVVTTVAKWQGTNGDLRCDFPIGRPIPNSQTYVLDKNKQVVPVGVPGELYIAGRGVARGYFNRQQLTADQFVRCPFGPDPNARMYRTGDRVRWLRDGQIEFLDRMDNQVKVRGFRVEPREIASNLENLAQIQQSVVIAREDENQEIQLIAYVVPTGKPAGSPRELRAALSQRLPAYMIPSEFVFLDAFPLTKNGKVDEAALPRIEVSSKETLNKELPQTDTQRDLAAIWQEILGISAIGLHDHFFEVGGHSLRAMQMVARIANRFHLDLPLRDVFEHPTLAALAVRIDQLEHKGQNALPQRKLPSIAAISQERRRKTA